MEEKKLQDKQSAAINTPSQDGLSAVVFALILIWAGVVLLGHNLGFMGLLEDLVARLPLGEPDLPWDSIPFVSLTSWRLLFLGAGALVLIEVLIRLIVPAYRRRLVGSVIGAAVLITVGLGTWNLIGPVLLIAVGAAILFGGVLGRRVL